MKSEGVIRKDSLDSLYPNLLHLQPMLSSKVSEQCLLFQYYISCNKIIIHNFANNEKILHHGNEIRAFLPVALEINRFIFHYEIRIRVSPSIPFCDSSTIGIHPFILLHNLIIALSSVWKMASH